MNKIIKKDKDQNHSCHTFSLALRSIYSCFICLTFYKFLDTTSNFVSIDAICLVIDNCIYSVSIMFFLFANVSKFQRLVSQLSSQACQRVRDGCWLGLLPKRILSIFVLFYFIFLSNVYTAFLFSLNQANFLILFLIA